MLQLLWLVVHKRYIYIVLVTYLFMKTINVTFTDKEWKRLIKRKVTKCKNWRNCILQWSLSQEKLNKIERGLKDDKN